MATIDARPPELALKFPQGDTVRVQIAAVDADGDPFPLAGSLAASIRVLGGNVVVQAFTITGTPAVDGTFALGITAGLSALIQAGTYGWCLVWTDEDGFERDLLAGPVEVSHRSQPGVSSTGVVELTVTTTTLTLTVNPTGGGSAGYPARVALQFSAVDLTSGDYMYLDIGAPGRRFFVERVDLTCTSVDNYTIAGEFKLEEYLPDTPTPAVAASGLLTPGGANNDIVVTAAEEGTAGNSITVTYVGYVDPGIPDVPLSLDVSGNDITVNLATGPDGFPTSTANDVLAAILASGPASALVTAANLAGNNGSGNIFGGSVALSGGVEGTAFTIRQAVVDPYIVAGLGVGAFQGFSITSTIVLLGDSQLRLRATATATEMTGEVLVSGILF